MISEQAILHKLLHERRLFNLELKTPEQRMFIRGLSHAIGVIEEHSNIHGIKLYEGPLEPLGLYLTITSALNCLLRSQTGMARRCLQKCVERHKRFEEGGNRKAGARQSVVSKII